MNPKHLDGGSHYAGSQISRRRFFDRISDGLYGTALATLLSQDLYGGAGLLASESHGEAGLPRGHRRVYDLKPREGNFPAKAKAVIHLVMDGGPSHMDIFDPKPVLEQHNGKEHSFAPQTNPNHVGKLLRSPFSFKQYGQSGTWVSDLMPHLARHVDDITVIRSMHTTSFNHEPAMFMLHTGRMISGRPSLGSWVGFGLGTENQNLPAYVVLDDPLGPPLNGVWNWQAGFLPPVYQGMLVRSVGAPILDLAPDGPESPGEISAERELISRLDQFHKQSRPRQLQLDARITSYQLAARLQLEAGDALDISKEAPATREMYGIGKEPTDSYGRRCLMARRLVERGVRFVQLYINKAVWDTHSQLEASMRTAAQRTDQPIGALLEDLQQRGLLDSTLLIWGGEFGRMPSAEFGEGSQSAGRDHNPKAFSLWMAGGGVKRGLVYGATDELGYEAVENKVSVTDWHATILHLLGMDYRKLVFDQNGLEDKLTSVYDARIVKEILV
jgi:hypothetical protein